MDRVERGDETGAALAKRVLNTWKTMMDLLEGTDNVTAESELADLFTAHVRALNSNPGH